MEIRVNINASEISKERTKCSDWTVRRKCKDAAEKQQTKTGT